MHLVIKFGHFVNRNESWFPSTVTDHSLTYQSFNIVIEPDTSIIGNNTIYKDISCPYCQERIELEILQKSILVFTGTEIENIPNPDLKDRFKKELLMANVNSSFGGLLGISFFISFLVSLLDNIPGVLSFFKYLAIGGAISAILTFAIYLYGKIKTRNNLYSIHRIVCSVGSTSKFLKEDTFARRIQNLVSEIKITNIPPEHFSHFVLHNEDSENSASSIYTNKKINVIDEYYKEMKPNIQI